MNFQDINSAIYRARLELEAVDNNAHHMAGLLVGRLKHVPSWRLKELKKELKDFNGHTGKWK